MQLLFQNILQALRSLRTQVWQVTVSALGLAVSIVCLSFSVNWLWSETNYDAFRPDYKDLYVLLQRDSTGQLKRVRTYWDVEPAVKVLQQHGDSAGIVNISRFGGEHRIDLARTDSATHKQFYECSYMSASALRALGVEVLSGDIDEALRDREKRIVITDRMAMRLFGHTDVVGHTLHNSFRNMQFTITAVVKANAGKSLFPYDCILNLQYCTYFMKETITRFYSHSVVFCSRDIDATMRALEGAKLKERDGSIQHFHPASLRTYPRLYGDMSQVSIMDDNGFLGAYFYQIAFVVVSLLLLLSALANLIAVNTSICLSRTREYALRRSLGGSTWQNAQWLLTGIVPTLLLAVMVSAVAWEWMLKMQWVAIDEYRAMRVFWLMVLAAVFCCLLGMSYPIIKMHRIYKRSFAGSGAMGHSHGWLVAVQCVVCAFLLFLSWGMSRQLNDMMNEDLGLDTRNLLRLYTGMKNSDELYTEYNFTPLFRTLPQEFKKHSGAGIVDAVAVRTDIFNRVSYRSVMIGNQRLRDEYQKEDNTWVERHRKELVMADFVELEYSTLSFFGLHAAEGKKMDERVSHTESFAQVYGDKRFMDLVGRDAAKREPLYIIDSYKEDEKGLNIIIAGSEHFPTHWVGQEVRIVDEVNLTTTDFHQQHYPTIYVGVPDGHSCAYIEQDAIYIRYAEGRLDDAEAAVRQVLRDMDVPDNQYLLTTYEEYMAKSYKEDIFYANLVSWLTAFSFLVTLAGVFSTLLYTLRLQRRNLAIRRVMGAEFGDVFYGTLRPYVIYAVLGAAVAFAPALLLMRKWMSYFSYGSAPGVGLMLCILLMMLTVITLIVLWQVNKSMNEKPIDVLRPEA